MQRTEAPFRADIVGSFLRPDAVKQARVEFSAGRLDAEGLRKAENAAIRDVVEQQQAAGLQVVTDGEFRRAGRHFDFFGGLAGVEPFAADRGFQVNGVRTATRGLRVP